MVKLIQSSQFSPDVGVGMELVDFGGLVKSAEKKNTETIFGKSYDELKPDKKHVGIHVVALGDEEHYGPNRNMDAMPADSLRKYHDTFVTHGHVFRHHRNKDPKKSIGDIVASAYNEPMGRVELFIHADRDKAAPELERLERDGEIPFSMALNENWDECSVCHQRRSGANDPKQCVHIREHLGEMSEDGKRVYMVNREYTFFDISFVGKPADRIAWDLMKVYPDDDSDDGTEEKDASATLPFDSVKLAEYYGVEAPDDLAISSDSAVRKYAYANSLIEMYGKYTGFLSKSASADSARDRYLVQLIKVSASPLKDSTIDRLRELDPPVAFRLLGDAGVVMDSRTFFKYAMGDDFGAVEPYLPEVPSKVAEVLKEAKETSSLQKLCNDGAFDALPYGIAMPVDRRNLAGLEAELKEASVIDSVDDAIIGSAIYGTDPKLGVDIYGGKVLNSGIAKKLAAKYAAYKLAAIDATVTSRRGQNPDTANTKDKLAECTVALSALQDMRRRN